MKQRFEMPIGPDAVRGYNLFEIDDFLRSIRTSEERKRLISEVGFSQPDRDTYETDHGLPHGAVELAMMLEDRRIQEINDMIKHQIPELYESGKSWQKIHDIYQELGSVATGLRATYPDATSFLLSYSQMADRTRRSFRGDYRFSNEYRMMQVQALDGGPNPPPNNTTAWTYQAVYIAAFANAIVVANAVLWANALVLTLAILAGAVFAVAAAVTVVPLYGQKQILKDFS